MHFSWGEAISVGYTNIKKKNFFLGPRRLFQLLFQLLRKVPIGVSLYNIFRFFPTPTLGLEVRESGKPEIFPWKKSAGLDRYHSVSTRQTSSFPFLIPIAREVASSRKYGWAISEEKANLSMSFLFLRQEFQLSWSGTTWVLAPLPREMFQVVKNIGRFCWIETLPRLLWHQRSLQGLAYIIYRLVTGL